MKCLEAIQTKYKYIAVPSQLLLKFILTNGILENEILFKFK